MPDLYHWEPNTVFLKPLIALNEKGSDVTRHYFDPTQFEQFGPDFPRSPESDLNPEREGPVLVADHTVISHSFFMLEYIAEAMPGPDLYPGDAYGRYRVRAWGQFIAQQLAPGVCALGCAKYLAPVLAARDRATLDAEIARIAPIERRQGWEAIRDGVYDAEALDVFRERLKMPVKRIEAALAESDWLAGPDYSLADIDAYAMLRNIPDLAPDLITAETTPRLTQFLERMSARPAVKEALAQSRTGAPETAFVPGPEPPRWG